MSSYRNAQIMWRQYNCPKVPELSGFILQSIKQHLLAPNSAVVESDSESVK